ncbi:MAG: hypothetical protein R3C10_15335 [Pirellulales bacterium]
MPLDPGRRLLKEMSDAGVEPYESLTPAEARKVALLSKALSGPPEDVARVEYRFVPGPTADLPVWIYRPVAVAEGRQPALVYFQGSGWVVSNIAKWPTA